jgi:death-on-curing protein
MNTGEPRFLTRAQIERLHDQSLAEFGGSAGVRDEGLIDSALASAKNPYFYGYGDLFDIAAAYAFHLAESQAFLDGNKRTAIGAALTFLDLNGITRLPDDAALYDAMIAIANKQLNKVGLAALFRKAAEQKD